MPYRRTAHTEARKAENRRRILEAARRLVAEGGFNAVQVGQVASAAGLANGTVYRYFPSKAELCAAVVRSVSEHELAVLTEVASSAEPASVRLAAAVRAFAGRAMRGRVTACALIAEPMEPLVEAERQVHRRALAQVFQAILADGMRSGEFPAQDAEVSAACLVGTLTEALISLLKPPPQGPDAKGESLLDSIARFCLRATGCRPDAVERVVAGLARSSVA